MQTLIIESKGGANLGHCYNAMYYTVKSLNRPLVDSDLTALRDLGWLGYGQEFYIRRSAEPEVVDQHNRYHVVNVESRVDSSD